MATDTRHIRPLFSPSQVSTKSVLWAVGTTVLLLGALWLLRSARISLGLVLAAFILAISADHAVQWLQGHRWKRGLAIAAVMATLVLVLGAFVFLIVPPTINQAAALVSQVPHFARDIQHSRTFLSLDTRLHIRDQLDRLPTFTPEKASSLANGILSLVGDVALVAGGGLTVFILTNFMLIFGPAMVRHALQEARRSRLAFYERIVGRIYTSLGGYVGGIAIIATLNATILSVFLAIIRVPFFLPLGALSGLLNLIPNLGPAVAFLIMAVVSLLSGGPWRMLALIIFYAVYKPAEDYVIQPVVLKRTAQVNPLAGTIAVLIMGEVAGIGGALLAVPALATAQIILGELLAIRREWLQREEPRDAPTSVRLKDRPPPDEPLA